MNFCKSKFKCNKTVEDMSKYFLQRGVCYLCLFEINFSQIDIYSFNVGSFILECADISKIFYFPCQYWVSRDVHHLGYWHELAKCYNFIYCNLFFMPEFLLINSILL